MKIIAIILNIFMPGVGTLVIKKWWTGLAQILLSMLAAFLMMTLVGSPIGMILGAIVWVWALLTVVRSA